MPRRLAPWTLLVVLLARAPLAWGQDRLPSVDFGQVGEPADASFLEESNSSLAHDLEALRKEVRALQDAEKKRKATAASKPSFQINGQLQADWAWFGQDAENRAAVGDIEDGTAFRRARFVSRGEAFEVINYVMGFDFSMSGRPSFLDVYVGAQDLPYVGNFRVGHFFEPFSLERLTRNRHNTFMERSLADTFAPARNLGAMIFNTTGNENATWALGTFRTASDDFGDDVGNEGEQAVTARVTWLPFYDEASEGRSYVHVGMGYTFRDADEGVVRFRQTPEVHLVALGEGQVPFFVDTGNIAARSHQAGGAEFAWILGPLSLQSEYMFVAVDRAAGDTAYFHAVYGYVSYFLTGEHRPYIRAQGIHDRIQPFENFLRVRTCEGDIVNGVGAWEVAARWSMIDLNDSGINGGRLNDVTLGLNWYLNPYTRVKWEYIHAFLDTAPIGDSNCDIVAMRFDIDF